MNEIDKLLFKAKQHRNQEPLITMKELRSLVDQNVVDYDTTTQKSFIKRKKNMVLSLSALLSTITAAILSFYPANYNSELPVSETFTAREISSLSSDKSSEYNESAELYTQLNTSDKSVKTVLKSEREQFSAVNSINALNMIELTPEQFNKIVPGTFYSDGFLCTFGFDNFINTSDDIKHYDTLPINLGYPELKGRMIDKNYYNPELFTDNNRPFVQSNNKTYPTNYKFAYGSPTGYLAKAVVSDTHKIIFMGLNHYSPLYYHQPTKEIEEIKLLIDKHRLSTDFNEVFSLNGQINAKILECTIPVRVKLPEASNYFVFWFVPNEEFLSLIPQNDADDIRKELKIKEALTNRFISNEEACQNAPAKSYLNVCGANYKAIQSATMNSINNESITLEINSVEQTEVEINIANIAGKSLCTTYKSKLSKGSNTLTIPSHINGEQLIIVSITSSKGDAIILKYTGQ